MNLSNYFINPSLEFRLLVALASLAIAAAVIAGGSLLASGFKTLLSAAKDCTATGKLTAERG